MIVKFAFFDNSEILYDILTYEIFRVSPNFGKFPLIKDWSWERHANYCSSLYLRLPIFRRSQNLSNTFGLKFAQHQNLAQNDIFQLVGNLLAPWGFYASSHSDTMQSNPCNPIYPLLARQCHIHLWRVIWPKICFHRWLFTPQEKHSKVFPEFLKSNSNIHPRQEYFFLITFLHFAIFWVKNKVRCMIPIMCNVCRTNWMWKFCCSDFWFFLPAPVNNSNSQALNS